MWFFDQTRKTIISIVHMTSVIGYVESDYHVKCSYDECNWICRISKLAKTKMLKIRHIAEDHAYASNIVLGSYRQVTK